ncbi:MAG: sigma-70 family RNA polymerase sigma factor [Acidobacteriota bacterium]|nr:sigma-70 family RNA polymerase sigma factor [Acidobacteriota bacterium]MDH3531005.1 sigma-70 family RNA polymerase sigma factor [Acidobacteriota bacterium]
MDRNPHITGILQEWGSGNQEALDDLMPLVYDELHRQASRYLRGERANHTLQTTALINETYLKLVDQRNVNWESRTHFFAIASKLMRRILVDHAREKKRAKRGGDAVTVSFDETTVVIDKGRTIDLIILDEALNRLMKKDERQVRVVECRYFGGLTLEETASALKLSRTTVANDWMMAKAWLHRELTR